MCNASIAQLLAAVPLGGPAAPEVPTHGATETSWGILQIQRPRLSPPENLMYSFSRCCDASPSLELPHGSGDRAEMRAAG